jgi:hypothetical protein
LAGEKLVGVYNERLEFWTVHPRQLSLTGLLA